MSKSSSCAPRPGKRGPAPVVPPPGADAPRRIEQNQPAIRLLEEWQSGDAAEQRATWRFLRQALDENPPSHRQLFD